MKVDLTFDQFRTLALNDPSFMERVLNTAFIKCGEILDCKTELERIIQGCVEQGKRDRGNKILAIKSLREISRDMPHLFNKEDMNLQGTFLSLMGAKTLVEKYW